MQAGVTRQVSSLRVIFDLPHSDLNNVEIQGVLVTRLAVQQCSPLSCLWKERGSDSQGLGPS